MPCGKASLKPKNLKHMHLPIVHLKGIPLQYVSSHLGVKMCDSQRDDDDIIQQLLGVYTRGNMLIKNFSNGQLMLKVNCFSHIEAVFIVANCGILIVLNL